jgi:S-DNA-T family DNA segregation ATPase FtsK/SpoIIIE
MLLALVSYHPHDPGFADTGEPGPVGNWMGPVGAWVAGFFLFLFGRPSYLFPVMLAYAGWLVHKDAALPDARSRVNTLLRAIGFALTLLSSCGLATLHWSPVGLPNSAGGVLGELTGHGSAQGLSFLGATLLLFGSWLAGVALFLGVSWFRIMDNLGAAVLKSIEWISNRFEQKRELASGQQRKQARQEVVREEQKKVAARPPPRIEAPAPVPEKSERVERERQVPLFDSPQSSELPAMSLLDEAGPREQSYSDEALEAMSRLVEIKLRDFGRDHALRAASGTGSQSQPDQQSGEGFGAGTVGHQRARGGDHSRQIRDRPGDPQREARDRHARRDHQIQTIR